MSGAFARWIGPRGRRKLRLLRRRPAAFAAIYWRGVTDKMAPLPNPPWYQESEPVTRADVARAGREAWQEYVATWRDMFPRTTDGLDASNAVIRQAQNAEADADVDIPPSTVDTKIVSALQGVREKTAASVGSTVEGHVRLGQTDVSKPESLKDAASAIQQLGKPAVSPVRGGGVCAHPLRDAAAGETAADIGRSAAPVAKSFAAERVDIAKEALQVGRCERAHPSSR